MTKHVDVEGLLAIPRLIFDRMSASYAPMEDRSGQASTAQSTIVRPLLLSPLTGVHGHPSLVLQTSVHGRYNEYGSRVALLAGTPTEPEHLDTSDLRALRVLVQVSTGRRYDHQSEESIERRWYLTANADFGRSNAFGFLEYRRYWPLTLEILEQFSAACEPYEGSFQYVERVGAVSA